MCGIAGLMTRDGTAPDAPPLRAMTAALAHRGPDGTGTYRSGDVGMVQTRLAIVDLVTGDQPLFEPGGAGLVANGEIYNHLELRAELNASGRPPVVFSTRSDCELPLHLYRRHGLEFTRYLRGMYAIALHDPASGRLVLARDPFGIKPLYYAETSGAFAFASEPRALIAAGLVAPRLCPQARDELLQIQFTTGRRTIFAGIDRVLPGETIVVHHGRVVERRFRSALPEGGPAPLDRREATARLDAALRDSVRLHLRADVPLGLFLSGGIDSTAIMVATTELGARPEAAFTIGFPGGDVADERAAARAAAEATGVRHVEITFDADDFWRLLPAAITAVDDPAADWAMLPTLKLAREARRAGLKVVLSGEGGDELLAGYGRYRSLRRPWWIGGRVPRARGALDGLGVLRGDLAGWRDGIAAAEAQQEACGRNALQTAQAIDFADWLPNDLLIKLDRCLMAHGVEGRTPYLDPVLADFAFCLPDRLKIRRGLGKWLLRHWLAARLPEARPLARKSGFTVPVGQLIATRARKIGPFVAASEAIREICRPEAVLRLFADLRDRRAARAAWHLLFYAMWHRHHIEGIALPPDAFAALTRAG